MDKEQVSGGVAIDDCLARRRHGDDMKCDRCKAPIYQGVLCADCNFHIGSIIGAIEGQRGAHEVTPYEFGVIEHATRIIKRVNQVSPAGKNPVAKYCSQWLTCYLDQLREHERRKTRTQVAGQTETVASVLSDQTPVASDD